MMARVETYRKAVVEFAQVAKASKDAGATVAEAEWDALIATDGKTKSIPLEVNVWLMSQKTQD